MKGMKQVLATELREGYGVKAPGAPAWSTIRNVEETTGGVTVTLDWGTMVYDADEKVWIESVSLA